MIKRLKINNMVLFDLDLSPYSVEIQRKPIKHIYFRVKPKIKTILISAPLKISDDHLNQAILSKYRWLKKQIEKPVSHHLLPPELTYATGDRLSYLGGMYDLILRQRRGVSFLELKGNQLILYARSNTAQKQREKIVLGWFREQLHKKIGEIVHMWEPVLNVRVNQYRIRKMKTRWGSCNVCDRRIWINFYLIHLRPALLEYVVVHEMAHLIEKSHNHRFKQIMNKTIPDWRSLKNELNESDLYYA